MLQANFTKKNIYIFPIKNPPPLLPLLLFAYSQFPVPLARMIKPLFNVFSRNDTHTRFALFGKIYFLAFRNKRWSERKSREIIATKRQAKDDRSSPLLLQPTRRARREKKRRKWIDFFRWYKFVDPFRQVSFNRSKITYPLLFPLVSGITSRRMRTRVACNMTVITRKGGREWKNSF